MKLEIIALILVVASATTPISWTRYDRCDPKWMLEVQDQEVYDCVDPTKPNLGLGKSSLRVAFANVFSTFGVQCLGRVCDPPTTLDYIVDHWKKYHREDYSAVTDLGFDMCKEQDPVDVPTLKKRVEEHKIILVQTKRGEWTLLDHYADTKLHLINSRGKDIEIGINDYEYFLWLSCKPKLLEFLP
eukprot:TRINITY_DN17627_c0_g1_i1.p2 TRINITY_DN17627_c0_g1~~TRINITY_DN17627_c0_g1_i1.p2  ORF type:complete len:186 (-),score=39.54 TRINITY_DN17627_c0_g1_i1:135-692(-)